MWLIKHQITNLYGECRHSSTHFNHCCRYRWAVMLCPLPHGKNPHYLLNKLDWPQEQYRCHSKEIVFVTVFCVLWVYMLEMWGAFIPSLKHNYTVTQGCALLVEQDPNWCQSIHKTSLCYSISQHFHKTQYDLLCVQKSVSCCLAKWLATAVPLAIQYAAASSSNICELLLFSVECELCF